jgi:hypothetical protein
MQCDAKPSNNVSIRALGVRSLTELQVKYWPNREAASNAGILVVFSQSPNEA